MEANQMQLLRAVLSAARALVYGSVDRRDMLQDALEQAVYDCDGFALTCVTTADVERDLDEVLIPEHVCHEQAIDLGSNKPRCAICGSIQQGLRDGPWVAPKASLLGSKETT